MLAQQFISEPCSWFHRQENYAQALLIEKLSGIGLNRMGSTNQCIDNPTLRYFIIEYNIAHLEPTFYTGLCYSSNCTASDLMYITKSVNEYIPLPFEKFAIFQPYTESNIMNQFMITLIAIMGMVILVSILGTLVEKCMKKGDERWKKYLTVFSITNSIKFMFRKSKNNERIKIIAGLRAFAFLGITFYSMAFALMGAPSMPQPSDLGRYIKVMFFFYDLWLAISGFYLSCELYKYWSKDSSVKNILFTFLRKLLKTTLISTIAIIGINALAYSKTVTPLWSLAYSNFLQSCHFLNILNSCNYGLWLWTIELQMCALSSLLFILWHSRLRFSKVVYFGLNGVIVGLGALLAVIYGQDGGDGALQGDIGRCPIVGGVAYIVGFNLGLLYFWFRTHRNKSRILMIRVFKYKANRIITSLLAISILVLINLYFIKLQPQIPQKTNQILLQLFRIMAPLCYCLLILPQLLGFQNIWGALLKDRFMNVASRLSFSSYTLYYGICLAIINSLQEDLYLNFAKLLSLWMCAVLVSLGLGFGLCVLVEVPGYRGLHAWLGRSSPKAYIEFY